MVTLTDPCPDCDERDVIRHGYTRKGKQRYRCRACGRSFVRDPGARVTRLVVADDHDVTRASIKAMLSGERDLRVIGEAESGREALGMCHQAYPDLVLMDLRMPGMSGLEVTREIRRQFPYTTGVLILATVHEDQECLLEALRAGARGYVLKDVAPQHELVTAIRKAAEGEFALNRRLVTRLLLRLAADERGKPAPADSLTNPECVRSHQPLTPREIEVLELMSLGKTNRGIARSLMISPPTVKRHLENIAFKTRLINRVQLVVWALEQGIISFPSASRS